MQPVTDRRRFLAAAGATVAAAAVLTPEHAFAATGPAGWQLGFADLEGDVAPAPMRLVAGRAPASLAGTLYRNGPAKFRRGGTGSGHWFDGDGLLRKFVIDGGAVTMAARFVDTPKRRVEAAAGR